MTYPEQYVRQNVWELEDLWATPVLWYARGVKALKARPLADPTSWRFYGAIHGIDVQLWQQLGYLSPSDTMPGDYLMWKFWSQCQHGSWYFLPWHRGYLLAFEANVRRAVVELGGPQDWALPYWNYFKDGQSQLPPAFAEQSWPDGNDNPLYVRQRYGPENDRKVFVPIDQVNLNAMNGHEFTGVASGGDPGFGGVDTGFQHSGNVHGGIETQPHDWVHGLVGGAEPPNLDLPGLMSDPDTAALDPIFWLHHANIDRLWEVWRQNPVTNVDPTDANWLEGPGSTGDRVFAMPMPGTETWHYTPEDMEQLSELGYMYDDLTPAAPAPQPGQRLLRLGVDPSVVHTAEGAVVENGENVELVGANREPLQVTGDMVRTSVEFDAETREKVTASLARVSEIDQPSPDRVFLNLENVRGRVDSTAFRVYVGLPEGANPVDHPASLAGSIALFGVRKASRPDGDHAGQGLTFVLDITAIVDQMYLDHGFDVDSLAVSIVPVNPVPATSEIRIGRVSIFRQGI